MNEHKKLLVACRDLRKRVITGNYVPYMGICNNLDIVYRIDLFYEVASGWPEHTGYFPWPIERAKRYFNNRLKWEGESGRKRRSLLVYVISRLEAIIADEVLP